MATETQKPFEELRFDYPKVPWGLALFCSLWLAIVFVVPYLPTITSRHVPEDTGFPKLALFLPLLAMPLFMFLMSGILGGWFTAVFRRGTAIAIREDGISLYGRLTRWDDIARMDLHFPALYGGMRVRLKLRRIGFFEVQRSFERRSNSLWLMGYPLVYRDVIPAIRRLRPEISITSRLEAALADPERAWKGRKWPVRFLLGLSLAALLLADSSDCLGTLTFLYLALALMALGYWSVVALPWARDSRERFLQSSMACPFAIGIACLLYPFSWTGPHALHALLATAIVLTAAGVVVSFAGIRLHLSVQRRIAALLVIAPLVAYGVRYTASWERNEVTRLFSPDRQSGLPHWRASSRYLCADYGKDMDFVVEVPSLTKRPVQMCEGFNTVVWQDDRYLIRLVTGDCGTPRDLWVYDFTREFGYRLPTTQRFAINWIRPISPGGRRLAWVEWKGEGNPEVLRIWDLQSERDDVEAQPLPGGVEWFWHGANWLNGQTFVVLGRDPAEEEDGFWKDDKPYSLHLLRIATDSGQTIHTVTSRKSRNWTPLPNLRQALVYEQENGDYRSWVVNLETGDETPLPGTVLWSKIASSADCAFRTAKSKGRNVLERLDFDTLKVTPLHALPKGLELWAVSDSGRLALLVTDEFMGMGGCVLMHTASGKTHRLELPGMVKMFGLGHDISPGDKYLVMDSFGLGGYMLTLVTVPEGWPER